MNPATDTTLTPERAKLLDLLSGSDVARTVATEAIERRRRERTTVLRTMAEEKRRASTAVAAAVQSIPQLRQQIDDASATLRALEAALRQRETEASVAQMAGERAENVARWRLRQLGGEAIESARRKVATALQEARAAVNVRERRDSYGNLVGVDESSGTLERIGALQKLVVELDAMELCDRSPDDIEQRCAEIVKAAERPAWLPEIERGPYVLQPL